MKVNRKKTLEVLTKLSPVVKNQKVDSEASYYVFNKDSVCTMNEDCFMMYDKAVLDFPCAIRGAELMAVLNRIKDEEIDIDLEDKQIKIKGRRAKAGIPTFDKMHTPIKHIKQEVAECFRYEFTPDIISLCVHLGKYTANDPNNPICSKVHLTNDYVEAVNGLCLARSIVKTEQQEEGIIENIPLFNEEQKIDILIPKQSISVINSFKPSEFSVTSQWLHMFDGDYSCSIRRFAGDFMDFTSFLDLGDDAVEYMMGSNVLEAIDTVLVISKMKTEDNKPSEIICKIDESNVTLSCKGARGSWYSEKIEQDNTGKPTIVLTLTVNALKDILSNTDKIMTSKPTFIDPKNPESGKYCFVKYTYNGVEHLIKPFVE